MKRKGFTILELLVTVAIINIIAALLLSAVSSSREKARFATCINNQRNLTGTLIMYAMDNGAFPNDLTAWLNHEGKTYYAKNASFWQIQEKVYANTPVSTQSYFDGMFYEFKCPESKYSDKYQGVDYGMNQIIKNMNYGAIVAPEKMIVITDVFNSYSIAYPNDIDFRHHGGALAGFVDGHVEWVKPTTLYQYDAGGIGFAQTTTDIDTNLNGIPDSDEFLMEQIDFNFAETIVEANKFIWNFLGTTDNGDGTWTFNFQFTNNNKYALSNIAFELPTSDSTAVSPETSYQGSQNTYNIENGTNAPFRSIKFETQGEGIKNGGQETFTFKLSNNDVQNISKMRVRAKASKTVGEGQYNVPT